MSDTNPAERLRDGLHRLRGDRGVLWYVGAAVILVILAARSCVTVEPGHVAVGRRGRDPALGLRAGRWLARRVLLRA